MSKITAPECQQLTIEELRIISMECSVYCVRVVVGGEEKVLVDKDGKARIFRSVTDAKQPFKGMDVSRAMLVQHSPYGEMVGLPPHEVDPLAVRISLPDDDITMH